MDSFDSLNCKVLVFFVCEFERCCQVANWKQFRHLTVCVDLFYWMPIIGGLSTRKSYINIQIGLGRISISKEIAVGYTDLLIPSS